MEIKSINGIANYAESPVATPTVGKTGTAAVSPIQKKAPAEAMDLPNNKQTNEQQIKSAVDKANQAMKHTQTRCEFSYHEPTKSISIKIIDEQTDEILREVPPEKVLDMIEKMWEMAGLLVDEKR
ncbi:flagellar protein FlaG [Lachnoclostridium phytofermentans]|uniref:Flagellar protein FlaG protein n=1 Tax=Lachnoclostridium phytofermentans (strain ATCC 700394 / DSM 18823 / ISDg) TaxID=357809 RepID=A9KSQ4_LACP7|nr:flagellar protein FlaG [Lachnoclostridium phytofermentans]ABX40698.1 flagellar protein FlaG protein [Lachnoclostridium phytofermentans ISDg]